MLRDDAAHAAHRKKFAAHFTPSNTNAFQPEIYDLVYQLIDVGIRRPPFVLPVNPSRSKYFTQQGIYGYAEQDAPIDCLAMIRHLMIDILAESAFGAQAASLRKWAAGEEDPLAVAVHDFPPLGVIVSSRCEIARAQRLTAVGAPTALLAPRLDLVRRVPDTYCSCAAVLQRRQGGLDQSERN